MKKLVVGALVAIACASCDRLIHRSAPDAGMPIVEVEPKPSVTPIIAPRDGGLSPSTLAALLGKDEDERPENPEAADATPACPMPIFPNYCRRRCRNYATREGFKHASRIRPPLRAGTGTCGAYKVFAEDEKGADGGPSGGIVEYFGADGNLVGAEDSRRKPCGTFGTIPKCKLQIAWGPPPGPIVGLGGLAGFE
jgi:hypothetical protein